jgi:DNA-binding MarR family transcriptional regulator
MLKRVKGIADATTITRLRQLSAEADQLADQLAAQQLPDIDDSHESLSTSARIRYYLRQRRRRNQLFAADLFADPAWDILLDLFASELDARPVSISDACLASGVPPTTALRWIQNMARAGHLHRTPSETDGRRVYLILSARSRSTIADWVSVTFNRI